MAFDFRRFLSEVLAEVTRSAPKPAPAKGAAPRLPLPDPPRRSPARSAGLPQGTGRTRNKGDYIEELCTDGTWRLQHRLVMGEQLGRPLRIDEEVHHCDINPRNNHPKNLAVVSKAHHNEIHRLWRDYEAALQKGHTRKAESIRDERKEFIRRNAIRS